MLKSSFLTLLLLYVIEELLEFGSEMWEEALDIGLRIDCVIIAGIFSDSGIWVMSVALLNWFVKFFQGVDVSISVDFVVELRLPMGGIASACWGVDFGTRERGLVL